MSRLPGVNADLALAVRQVNAAFARLPVTTQESIEINWNELDQELDEACAGDDRERAEAAIRAWRGHWLATIEAAK